MLVVSFLIYAAVKRSDPTHGATIIYLLIHIHSPGTILYIAKLMYITWGACLAIMTSQPPFSPLLILVSHGKCGTVPFCQLLLITQ